MTFFSVDVYKFTVRSRPTTASATTSVNSVYRPSSSKLFRVFAFSEPKERRCERLSQEFAICHPRKTAHVPQLHIVDGQAGRGSPAHIYPHCASGVKVE